MPFNGVSGAALLAQAVAALEAESLKILARSGVWETEAWPPESGQADYFNAVVELDPGALGPQLLYEKLRGIEARFGRERRERWAARTLDLDIAAVGDLTGTFGDVVVPHPRLAERAFVLAPLAEVAPNWRHPGLGLRASEMLGNLPPGYRYRRAGALA
jgi:2-amino-4-hydroxy-6-hydroxymethyldihydropteridine diphosphokinase